MPITQSPVVRVGALTEALLAAAEGAQSPLTEPALDETAAEAMAAERRLFAANVRHCKTRPDLPADPVPHRRVEPSRAAA